MKLYSWIPALLGSSALCAGLAMAYDVPKDLVIKRPEKNPPLATWVGPVNFPHGFHAVQNSCKSCHHEESDRSLGQFLPCTQCHNQTGMEEKSGFYRAWHSEKRQSCLGCHKYKRYTKQAMPPISCVNGCHKAPKQQGGGQ